MNNSLAYLMQHWGILVLNYSFIWNSHFIGHPVFDLATQTQVKGYVVIADHNYQAGHKGRVHRGERASTDPACGLRAQMWVVPILPPPHPQPPPSWRIKQLSSISWHLTRSVSAIQPPPPLVSASLSVDMNLLPALSGKQSSFWGRDLGPNPSSET